MRAVLHASAFACLSAFTTALAADAPAEPLALPNHVIVKLRESKAATPGVQSLLSQQVIDLVASELRVSLRPLRSLPNRALVVDIGNAEAAQVVSQFLRHAEVEYAEPDALLKPLLVPNDSSYKLQWHYYEGTAGIDLPAAWDVSTGSGVKVGVIDTGYRPHADLAANIVGGYDFISDTSISNDGNGRDSDARDPGDWVSANQCGPFTPAETSSWHGTHVAGTIAAVTNNGSGVAGVAFGAKVVPLRVLGKCGGLISDIADAIVWGAGGAVSGVPANANVAKVLSLSLGGSGACSATLQSSVNTARSLGSTVVVAAGNDNADASNSNPANCSGVIAVAAVDRGGSRAPYSNFGSVVAVAAPGGDETNSAQNGIYSTLNSGTQGPGLDSYAYYQGTSMATPHVSGVAALILSHTPGLTPDQVKNAITSTARPFPGACNQCGAGIVDAAAALGVAGGGQADNELQNGQSVTGLSGAQGTELRYTMAVPANAGSLQFQLSGGSGDADLYVKFAQAPTAAVFDCAPQLSGNNETCSFNSPQAGTWYVMVRGGSSFSSVNLVGSFAGSDSTPDAFSFVDLTDVPRSTLETSNAVTIAGIDTAAPISVSGGSYSKGCTSTFTTAASTIVSGQTVCVRHTSSANYATSVNTTLTVGGVSDTFTSTTLAPDTTPNAFSFTDRTNVAKSSTITSNSVTITGISAAAPVSVTGGSYSIGCGTSFTAAAGSIGNNQTICVRHISASAPLTSVDTTLTIGGVSDTFTSTTAAPDYTPNSFSFTSQSNVPMSSLRTSNAVTISGIDNGTAVSVAGGEYSIGCSGAGFTSANGSINNNQTICVRHTSAAAPATTVTTNLTVGTLTRAFSSTTAADPGTKLASSTASSGLSGNAGEELRFSLLVPSGATAVRFELSGGSGDADLYVRFGANPTTTSFDCRPFVDGNDEVCTMAPGKAGTYYIGVRGFQAFSGVTLTASYVKNVATSLALGGSLTGLAGAVGSERLYYVTLPGDGSGFVVYLDGGSGNADLYVKALSAPTLASYDCAAVGPGNAQTCSIAPAVAGNYYILLRGYEAYDGVTLGAYPIFSTTSGAADTTHVVH